MLQRGEIVVIKVSDPSGANPKSRPVVIVSAPEPNASNLQYVGVAISTSIENPCPEHHVPLPWHAKGRARTGLTRPCVAKCDWRVFVDPADVERSIGTVPGHVMLKIIEEIRRLDV
ncbi:MAG: type II toxin-antitoxin system PemK/MazF family toxin [Planctomycetia bacterium]|nr:type II toxin-antitoxin system PemK/MazF family toxin [Planctomycetia bacterium]